MEVTLNLPTFRPRGGPPENSRAWAPDPLSSPLGTLHSPFWLGPWIRCQDRNTGPSSGSKNNAMAMALRGVEETVLGGRRHFLPVSGGETGAHVVLAQLSRAGACPLRRAGRVSSADVLPAGRHGLQDRVW